MWIDDDGPPVHVGIFFNFFKEKFQFLALYCRKRKFYNPAYNLYGNLSNNLGLQFAHKLQVLTAILENCVTIYKG